MNRVSVRRTSLATPKGNGVRCKKGVYTILVIFFCNEPIRDQGFMLDGWDVCSFVIIPHSLR